MSNLGGGGVAGDAPIHIKSAKGSLCYDANGKEYIDGQSQAWSLSLGHCHPEILEAIAMQAEKFTHIRTSFLTDVKLELAEKLTKQFSLGGKVMFALSGSDAIEGAIKIAIRHTKRQKIVSAWDGYHGRTLATMALSWAHPGCPFSGWGGPVVRIPNTYCYRCFLKSEVEVFPKCGIKCFDGVNELKNSELPAAIIIEPFQGNGGMIDVKLEFLKKLRNFCTVNNILLIYDEIQTGCGRCGYWSLAQADGIEPDIIVIGKGLGGGMPLFATISKAGIIELSPGDHSFTFAHFPLSMAAALTTIRVMERDKLFTYVNNLSNSIQVELATLKEKYSLIGDIRMRGFMIGIEIVDNRGHPSAKKASSIVKSATEKGLLLGISKYGGLGNVIKFKPALNIPLKLVEKSLNILTEVFANESKTV